ncbi:MAG TPA: YetF domain-containing protein [Dyadobacter sp.]|jgi:uncharacterized membrane protein YcaP (DUF421 family)|nr:YetF domain-containing protein [Dyadobacter sp.]
MKKDDITPGDLYRIVFGDTPVIFSVEILLRATVMYLILLTVVRLMGKRMGGQLTISELAVMVTLGAIVSPGMQLPQTGLLLCAMILVCALAFQRGINLMEFKHRKFETLSHGELSILMKNGMMQLDEMRRTKISKQQLFAVLRSRNIHNLGEVDRVYLEARGLFSVYKRDQPEAGLIIFPPADSAIGTFQQEVADTTMVCSNCGALQQQEPDTESCYNCMEKTLKNAFIITKP